jgi:hypothetical protein
MESGLVTMNEMRKLMEAVKPLFEEARIRASGNVNGKFPSNEYYTATGFKRNSYESTGVDLGLNSDFGDSVMPGNVLKSKLGDWAKEYGEIVISSEREHSDAMMSMAGDGYGEEDWDEEED